MLPADAPYIQRYVEYGREFGDLDDVVIVVEATSLPEATVYAGQLVRELRAARVPLTRLAYRIDPRQFEGRALLYLPLDKLEQIRERIFDYQDFMESFAGRPTLDELVDATARRSPTRWSAAFSTSACPTARVRSISGSSATWSGQISARLDRPAPYQSPWGALFSVGGDSASAGLLPVRRPATAVHPGRARVQEGQLHRRPGLHRRHPRGRRPAQGASSRT